MIVLMEHINYFFHDCNAISYVLIHEAFQILIRERERDRKREKRKDINEKLYNNKLNLLYLTSSKLHSIMDVDGYNYLKTDFIDNFIFKYMVYISIYIKDPFPNKNR